MRRLRRCRRQQGRTAKPNGRWSQLRRRGVLARSAGHAAPRPGYSTDVDLLHLELEDRGKKRTLRLLSGVSSRIRPALRAQPLTREAHIPHCTTNPYPEKHTLGLGLGLGLGWRSYGRACRASRVRGTPLASGSVAGRAIAARPAQWMLQG